MKKIIDTELRLCKVHGETLFKRAGNSNGFYCPLCYNERKIKYRQEIKLQAIQYLGGKCQKCGKIVEPYNFDFHHKFAKNLEITRLITKGFTFEQIISELDKCMLLCANCHMEEHERLNQENDVKLQTAYYRTKLRDKRKLQAIEYLGGKCKICGYNKSKNALVFHHRNPEEKEIQPGKLLQHSWEKIKIEIDKCDLLCVNCHRRLHNKI